MITADLLNRPEGPALSATSDMPAIEPVTPPVDPPVDPPAEPGEGDGQEPQSPAEGDEGEAGEGDEGQEAEPPAPEPQARKGIQRRFSELTTEKKIETAKREAAEAHAAKLEKLLADALAKQLATPEPPPAVVDDPRPVRETFDTPEDYDEALIEWGSKRGAERAIKVAQAENERHVEAERLRTEQETANRSQVETFEAMRTHHTERRAAFIEKTPDYAEVAEADNVPISLPMSVAIMQDDNGPAAAYYLGQHPDIAAKIAGMVVPGQVYPPGNPMAGQPVPDVQRQLVEMGKIFAAVTEPAPAPRRPAPPPPINPIRRSGNGSVAKSLEEIGNEGSMEDYAAARMPQLQGERRVGIVGRGN